MKLKQKQQKKLSKEETSEEQISARSFLDTADAAEVAAAAPAKEETEEPEETSEPDYKAMYEKTKLELEQAQKINTKKNIATDIEIKSDSDILNDLFKEFM